MAKLELALVLFSLVIAMPMVYSTNEGPKDIDEWFNKLPYAKQKMSKLHFYFHDQISGKNPTAVQVAQANMTNKSPTFFGMVFILDDLLTEGPEPTSKLVGRAQGLYGAAGLEEVSLIMAMNFAFTGGKYNGSTLTILGRNAALTPLREMPIVGGTGVFRLARGFARAKTYMFNSTNGDAIVEYNVYAIHY